MTSDRTPDLTGRDAADAPGPGGWGEESHPQYSQSPYPQPSSPPSGYGQAPPYGPQYPPAQGYGQPAPYGQPMYPPGLPYGHPYYAPPPVNGVGTAGGIVGIIGLVLFWFPYVGLLSGLAGVICGGFGLERANRMGGAAKGMAITGVICGGIAVLLNVIVILAIIGTFNRYN